MIQSTGKRYALLATFALGMVGMLVMASMASATHPRPKGATPLASSLVVSYKPCTSPNETHALPLGVPSCNPPVQTSNFLTVGSPDVNGAAANSTGKFALAVVSTPDVTIKSTITDIRCLNNAASGCAAGPSNANGQNDYTGTLEGTAIIRITDHNNGNPGPGGTDAATVTDIPFPVVSLTQPGSIPGCVSTASTTIGSTCTTNTTANTVAPGVVVAGKRANIEIGQVQIFDGGTDGSGATHGDNTLFEVQGIFIP
jgi:hypothetical protein